MAWNRRSYQWFYDKIHSRYYNLLIKWCFLPLGGEKKVRQELLEPVRFLSGDRILDMGCGTGNATFAIAEKVGEEAEIVGLDLSCGQIGLARKNNRFPNISFLIADASNAPFEEGCFDKVFITHAIHEMPREMRLKALREAKRILQQEGKVVVLELDRPNNFFVRLFMGLWCGYWLPFNFETPTRRDMLKHGVANEVEEAGFTKVRKISQFRYNYRGVFQVVEGEK